MVNTKRILLSSAWLLAFGVAYTVQAASNEAVPHFVSADSCDERLPEDGVTTAENRVLDKASLLAVKMSGFIQEAYPDLSPNALDVISYRIIDEYMMNETHETTFSDVSHVCVKVNATVLITPEELAQLAEEYKNSEMPELQISQVAEQVKENTTFRPQNLQQKKLVYIDKLNFWNGADTDVYRDFLTGLLSNSTYFYITDDAEIADYIVTPQLTRAEVNEIDASNHKMQMQIRLDVETSHDKDFTPLKDVRQHFILFAADKDEQEIADGLIRKLLTKSAQDIQQKLNKYLSKDLEKKALGSE